MTKVKWTEKAVFQGIYWRAFPWWMQPWIHIRYYIAKPFFKPAPPEEDSHKRAAWWSVSIIEFRRED